MDNIQLNDCGRIGVLMGGCSSERAISLKSGQAVLQALQGEGLDAVAVVLDSEDAGTNRALLRDMGIRVGFIALHGRYGEDGGIQSLLDECGIVYPGSGVQASRLAIHKVLTQTILKQRGLSVADFCALKKTCSDAPAVIQQTLGGYPVVVKPASEGSSIGIQIVKDPSFLEDALAHAFHYGEDVLVERFIRGRELTVGILGHQALPIVEIQHSHAFFDFEAKYQKGQTEYIVPARLDSQLTRTIQAFGLAAFDAVGCRDFARVDFLLAEDQTPYILEINTIPGFTGTSLLPMAARESGYEFPQLCLTLLRMALERSVS